MSSPRVKGTNATPAGVTTNDSTHPNTHTKDSSTTTTVASTDSSWSWGTPELTPENQQEFIGQIVEIFEDYLQDHAFHLHNSDREEAIAQGDYDDPSEAALIYGEAYDWIGNPVAETIMEAQLYHRPMTQPEVLEEAIDRIMAGWEEILRAGEAATFQGEEAVALAVADPSLREAVRATFQHWKVYQEAPRSSSSPPRVAKFLLDSDGMKEEEGKS